MQSIKFTIFSIQQGQSLSAASESERAMYSRYKYYTRLNSNIMGVMPEHVVPAAFYAPLIPVPPPGETTVKQSSFITM